MTVTFNQDTPVRVPADDTQQTGAILIKPPSPTLVELPIAETAGPAQGDYEIRNTGQNRPFGAVPGGASIVYVREFAAFGAYRWKIVRVGDVFRFTQRSTGRTVESHPGAVLTTPTTGSSAGIWASTDPILADNQGLDLMHLGVHPNANGLGAQRFGDHNSFVGREVAGLPSWIAEHDAGGVRLRFRVTGRYLDAHVVNSFRVVTRPHQANATQIFDVQIIGGVYTLQHEGLNFLDAFEQEPHTAIAVPRQFNPSQQWAIIERQDGHHTIQQASSGRFLSVNDTELVGFDPETLNTVSSADSTFQQFTFVPQ